MKRIALALLATLGAAGAANAQAGKTQTITMPATPAPVAVKLKAATTAVFVSDMVDPLCKKQPNCLGTMVPAVSALLARARKAGVMVAYSTQAAEMQHWLPEVAPAPGDPVIASHGQDRFYETELDKTLKAKGITTIVLTGWKISGSILYTSVGGTLRGYTNVIPVDGSRAASDYEEAIGLYQVLNQNAANADNTPLKPKATTLSKTDMITFE